MNLTNSRTALLAAILGAAALAGCDSVTTENATPAIARPVGTVVINGSVTGLGTIRPVELTITTTNNGLNDGSKTVGFRGTEILKFGAVQVGANYDIAISRTPAGRTCTLANGSGTAIAEVNNVTVTCVRDSTPLYTVTANIAAGLVTAPPEGFAVTLTTEEGTETISPAPGQASVTFTLPVFYPPGDAPPPFRYTVTATNTEGGTTNTCVVTAATGELAQPASGNVTTPTVASCLYTISAVAQYSAPPGGAPEVMGGGGLLLGLKSQLTGDIVVQAPVINAYGTAPVAFPGTFGSNPQALYEVVVQTHPAGQFCIVQGGGMAQLVTAQANVTVQVRCRNVPATANQLKGVYHLQPRTTDNAGQPIAILAPTRNFLTFFPDGTFLYGTHHNTATAGVEHGFYRYDSGAQTLAFNILTDTNGSAGSLDGVTVPAVAGCGYSFSVTFPGSVGPPCAPGAVTGPVTVFPACANTCTISAPAWVDVTTTVPSNSTGGLSGIGGSFAVRLMFNPAAFPPNFAAATAPLVATNVNKTAGSPGVPGGLSMQFGNYAAVFVEPVNTPNEIEGTWVSADSKRVFVHNKTTFYGFHAGVNGAPNLQDRCLNIDNPTLASSFYINRPGPNFFGTPTCMVATSDLADDAADGRVGTGTVDVPIAQTTPTNTTGPFIPGFAGRLPGTIATNVLNRSPVNYTVTPGNPDTITIQNTLNGIPTGDPVIFMRTTTY